MDVIVFKRHGKQDNVETGKIRPGFQALNPLFADLSIRQKSPLTRNTVHKVGMPVNGLKTEVGHTAVICIRIYQTAFCNPAGLLESTAFFRCGSVGISGSCLLFPRLFYPRHLRS